MKYLEYWKFSVLTILILWTQMAYCQNNEIDDIRVEIKKMYSNLKNTLERHVNDANYYHTELKTMIGELNKAYSTLVPMKKTVSILDTRLSNVETMLLQKENRDQEVQTKTEDTLDEIKISIQKVSKCANKNYEPLATSSEEYNSDKTNDDRIIRRLNNADQKLDSIQKKIEDLKTSLTKDTVHSICMNETKVNPFEHQMSQTENLLIKYEKKLHRYNETVNSVETDLGPLSEVFRNGESWKNNMTLVMERQEKEIKKTQLLLSNVESTLRNLPNRTESLYAFNLTLEGIKHIQHNITEIKENLMERQEKEIKKTQLLLSNVESTLRKLPNRTESIYALNLTLEGIKNIQRNITEIKDNHAMLKEMVDVSGCLLETNDNIMFSINQSNIVSEQMYNNLSQSYNNLLTEVKHSRIYETQSSIDSRQMNSTLTLLWQKFSHCMEFPVKLTQQSKHNGNTTIIENIKDKVATIKTHMREISREINFIPEILSTIVKELPSFKIDPDTAIPRITNDLENVKSMTYNLNHQVEFLVNHEVKMIHTDLCQIH